MFPVVAWKQRRLPKAGRCYGKLYEMKHKELTDFQRMRSRSNTENVKSFGRSAVERLMENVYMRSNKMDEWKKKESLD